MAVKKPLVLGADGRPQQLQSGDSLGVTSETGQFSMTAGAALIAGQAVYVSGAAAVNKARANAGATTVLQGLAAAAISNGVSGTIQLNGVLTLSTAEWDAVAGTTGGLTPGATYYLSAGTAGLLTATCPTTTGQYVVIAGVALSTVDFDIRISEPILL